MRAIMKSAIDSIRKRLVAGEYVLNVVQDGEALLELIESHEVLRAELDRVDRERRELKTKILYLDATENADRLGRDVTALQEWVAPSMKCVLLPGEGEG